MTWRMHVPCKGEKVTAVDSEIKQNDDMETSK